MQKKISQTNSKSTLEKHLDEMLNKDNKNSVYNNLIGIES